MKTLLQKNIESLAFLLFFVGKLSSQNVTLYSSTENDSWVEQKVKVIKTNSNYDLEIKKSAIKQKIIGIGGCFNELGWDALNSLNTSKKTEVLEEIFGIEGTNFNYCRMPIGANDFSLSFYSYNEVAEDFENINFNIDRDRYILIPYIQAAKKINPELKIWASPWCPPSWMKINNHYASKHCNSSNNDLNGLSYKKTISERRTGFKMQEVYLKCYADYFVRFIKAYEKEGIKISAICPQNEPLANQIFPSCTWSCSDLAFFVGKYLGPAFEQNNIDTDIYWGTINSGDPDYVRTAMRDIETSKYIKGIGFQWSGKKAIGVIHEEYPNLFLMQTETECGNGKNTWKYAEYTWNLMFHYFHNGINSYHYWNMVLPSENVSRWGWKQNSMVIIDKNTGTVSYTPEYYVMKHLSHFLKSGAYRIETPKEYLSFINPDGSIIVLMSNNTENDKDYVIRYNEKNIKATLLPHSFATLYIKN